LGYLLPLIPVTRLYVEPFGGGGSVLLNRPVSEIEVYNDLDGELVNLFRVLRDEDSYRQFRRAVAFMPYSRAEFERCLNFAEVDDLVGRAVHFYTVLNQSVSGKRLAGPGDWSRNRTINNADRWFARQEGLVAIYERIRTVQLECRDALDILKQWDTPDTTFYCDPPYMLSTRGNNRYYAVEPGDEWHYDLLAVLAEVRGCVVLSGYDHPAYRALGEIGWTVDTYGQDTTMDVANSSLKGKVRKRVEVVYRNPRAADKAYMRPLFNAIEEVPLSPRPL
jgi:DNA adenine methylase